MKTTGKDFELFKKECLFWINYFGLKDWHVVFHHDILEEDNFAAQCDTTLAQRHSTIFLNKELSDDTYPLTDEDIKQIAFHEVCELLLRKLRTLGENRYATEIEIYEATHEIISVLTNTLLPLRKYIK